MKSEAVEVIHYEITLQFLHHSMEENLNQCNDLKGGERFGRALVGDPRRTQ